MRLKYRKLALKLRIFAIEIETYLPDRDQLSIAFRQTALKPFKAVGAMPLNRYRVEAQGGVELAMLLCQR